MVTWYTKGSYGEHSAQFLGHGSGIQIQREYPISNIEKENIKNYKYKIMMIMCSAIFNSTAHYVKCCKYYKWCKILKERI